jgi:hypothetical protein
MMQIQRYYKYLIIFGLAVIAVLINGYHFEYADQEIYLAYLPVYSDAQAYPQSDLLMLGKQTGGNYYTYLWLILIPIFRLFGIEWTCFIVHILNIYLIYLALYFLTQRILLSSNGEQLPNKTLFGLSIAILLALGLLLTKKFVAGVSMVTIEPYLHPRNMALVLLLLAIERFLAEKRILSFCLAGLAANIHFFSAGIIIFCFLVAIVFEKQYKPWKSIFLSGLGFIICSSPVWIWILISSKRSMPSNLSSATWLSILQYRIGYLFPQYWDRIGWLAFLSILVVFSVGYYTGQNLLPNRKKLLGIIFGLFLLIFIGIIFSELIPNPWLIAFQTIRSIQFLIIISIILLVPYIIKIWNIDWIGKLCAVGSGVGIFLFEPKTILIFLIISLIYLTIVTRLTKNRKWVFAGILGLSVLVAIPFLWSRITAKIPQFNLSIQSVFHYIEIPGTVPPTPWQEVQLWARENSKSDSIWLTPLYLSGFRLGSHRSTIVEWKDGALGIFSPRYAEQWYQRMQDFGINIKTNVQLQPILFLSLTNEDLNRIAEKYQAKYIVVEKPKTLPIPLLYCNTQFNVYQVVGATQ